MTSTLQASTPHHPEYKRKMALRWCQGSRVSSPWGNQYSKWDRGNHWEGPSVREGVKAIETVGKGDSPLLPQKSGQGVGRDL